MQVFCPSSTAQHSLAGACDRLYDGTREDFGGGLSEDSVTPSLSFRSSPKLELGASRKGTPIFQAEMNALHWAFGICCIGSKIPSPRGTGRWWMPPGVMGSASTEACS